ncbi:cilia- and flagella-associated protein [Histomonas meleagridis]|uniref:cilia- and flagella-associated protein n=1 Tax=Histomonas meleagridis TaxID=135588 RepID=UPI0035599248|nr:cilia- and flagella-associated protein [Histomonas meleagridis]KAH0796498.1 cilia- and flagella-associated protein [Histomonas meleagridis]
MTTPEHEIVSHFETYEDYLDSKISQEHLYYLGNRDVARRLFELGCAGGSEVMDRKKFEQKKAELDDLKNAKRSAQIPMAHLGCDLSFSPLMEKLAEIEEEVRNGQKTALIFIRSINSSGQEVSGYIDYADRLRTEDWRMYFQKKKPLRPRPEDMSYYNWKTRTIHRNESSSFEVHANNDRGIIINNRRDMKEFSLDPADADHPGDNTVRYDIDDPNYLHVVLYVHTSRRKV